LPGEYISVLNNVCSCQPCTSSCPSGTSPANACTGLTTADTVTCECNTCSAGEFRKLNADGTCTCDACGCTPLDKLKAGTECTGLTFEDTMQCDQCTDVHPWV